MKGILGKKIGMSQVFKEDGTLIPVTLIEAGPCCVVQIKTKERDSYNVVKLGFVDVKKKKNMTKPMQAVFEKAGLKAYKFLKEFSIEGHKVGDIVTVDTFTQGEKVNITAVSKGKGFQGVMKRHNFSGGPGSHGSMFNRAPGSIGASAFPSRVWKNQKMAGHMGSKQVTVQNLTVIDVKAAQNLMIVKGAVPGAKGAIVEIKTGHRDRK